MEWHYNHFINMMQALEWLFADESYFYAGQLMYRIL